MNVRFRKQYSDSEPRMAYELEIDGPQRGYDVQNKKWEWYYATKLIGMIPTYKMEITDDETDQPAINVFVNLSNKL